MIRRALALPFLLLVTACGAPEGTPRTDTPHVTGLYVASIEGSGLAFSIVDVATGERVGDSDTDRLVELPEGTYHLHRRGRPKWVFAERVVVSDGEVARVQLSAIRVNAADASWDDVTYDIRLPGEDGDAVMAPLSPNELVPIAAGHYVLTHHYEPEFRFGVVMTAPGQIGEVTLGALRATTSAANDDQGFSIYEPGCEKELDSVNDGRLAHAVPPGSYCIRDRDLAKTILAADIAVFPGEVTSF